MAENITDKVFPAETLVEGRVMEWHDGKTYVYTSGSWVEQES
jgi:hypothetical protein